MKHTMVHFEIPADDTARAQAFYEKLFGWQIEKTPGMPGYMEVRTGDDDTDLSGALMGRENPEQRFVAYIGTASIDETLAKLEELGGTVALPKMAVPGMGWWAHFLDPEGNLFGLWQDDTAAA